MSESMVERVGRALAKAEGFAYDPYPYDERARAAIEEMRDPTDAMMAAAKNAVGYYEAMIDAALREDK